MGLDITPPRRRLLCIGPPGGGDLNGIGSEEDDVRHQVHAVPDLCPPKGVGCNIVEEHYMQKG